MSTTHDAEFGFNCFGCCWQMAYGEIVPAKVTLLPNESRKFDACVTYETCSGTMGPYPTSIVSASVPAPFVWDGRTITSDTAADADISFEGRVQEINPGCLQSIRSIFGFGRAEMCKQLFNPNCYNTQSTCSLQTSHCLECRACCQNIYQEELCKGTRADIALSFLTSCLGICASDYLGCDF